MTGLQLFLIISILFMLGIKFFGGPIGKGVKIFKSRENRKQPYDHEVIFLFTKIIPHEGRLADIIKKYDKLNEGTYNRKRIILEESVFIKLLDFYTPLLQKNGIVNSSHTVGYFTKRIQDELAELE